MEHHEIKEEEGRCLSVEHHEIKEGEGRCLSVEHYKRSLGGGGGVVSPWNTMKQSRGGCDVPLCNTINKRKRGGRYLPVEHYGANEGGEALSLFKPYEKRTGRGLSLFGILWNKVGGGGSVVPL